MKTIQSLILFLASLLIASINCPLSLADSEDDHKESQHQLIDARASGGSERRKLNEFSTSSSSGEDEQALALAELDRLKQIAIIRSAESLDLVESSIEDLELLLVENNNSNLLFQQTSRNYIVGTCSCTMRNPFCTGNTFLTSFVSTQNAFTTVTGSVSPCLDFTTNTCDTTCTETTSSCGLYCATYTSLTATTATRYNIVRVTSYDQNGDVIATNTYYNNGVSQTSSSISIYSIGDCVDLAAGVGCSTTTGKLNFGSR